MIFVQQLGKVDDMTPEAAVKAMERHIRYIQEQLEYTLSNLDSSNIKEIDTGSTNIGSSDGTVNISSDKISLSGKNREAFNAGYDSFTKKFIFEVKGKNGDQCIYLTSDGQLQITKNANLSIDSGTWD